MRLRFFVSSDFSIFLYWRPYFLTRKSWRPVGRNLSVENPDYGWGVLIHYSKFFIVQMAWRAVSIRDSPHSPGLTTTAKW